MTSADMQAVHRRSNIGRANSRDVAQWFDDHGNPYDHVGRPSSVESEPIGTSSVMEQPFRPSTRRLNAYSYAGQHEHYNDHHAPTQGPSKLWDGNLSSDFWPPFPLDATASDLNDRYCFHRQQNNKQQYFEPSAADSNSSDSTLKMTATVDSNDRHSPTIRKFDENNPQYRCCCRCCHVRCGALIVGVLELCYLAYQLVNTVILFQRSGDGHLTSFIITMIGIVLGVIAIILLFVGVCQCKPYMLVPHLLMQALGGLILLSLTILCAVALLTGSSVILRIINATEDAQDRPLNALGAYSSVPDVYFVSHALTLIIVATLLLFLLFAAVQLWLFMVVLWCYRYLRSKAANEQTAKIVLFQDSQPKSSNRHSIASITRIAPVDDFQKKITKPTNETDF